ncbi:PIR Superfamily Protein [Plasmodium ovale curtisi]|uniref:PIR Superfamily Protein n=2 Tax=Plasmodium ovale TaxID=36330 RepID=A0A1A8X585_PLAOA|nr:PIR Superfamily Protein [Plasmodium ovale curtisi]SBT00405.1 PIR Superfamily Protein [Plasmodium ovale curtisi]
MDTYQCPENYTNINTCYAYFLYHYNDVRSNFEDNIKPYLETIKKITDPILQHISLYLIDNYTYARQYFDNKGTPLQNEACKNLNRWLDQRKSLFTYAGKCQSNLNLWEKYIDPLWKELEDENKEKTCKRYKIYDKSTVIPPELLLSTCNKHVPDNYKCTEPSEITTCKCENTPPECSKTSIPLVSLFPAKDIVSAQSTFDVTSNTPSQLQSEMECEVCPSVTNYIIISVGFTLLFSIFFLFFLFKFTSFLSCFYNRQMKEERVIQDIVDEQTYEALGRNSQNTEANLDNRRNYLLYSSIRN